MQNNKRSDTFIASQDFLLIISKACQNYNEESVPERFISFLRNHIFCDLGNVSVELYFRDDSQNQFISYPSQPVPAAQNFTTDVPILIPRLEPLFTELFTHHTCLVCRNDSDTMSFLQKTGNQSHAIFPISQGNKTTALLYVGCRENYPFPNEYLQAYKL